MPPLRQPLHQILADVGRAMGEVMLMSHAAAALENCKKQRCGRFQGALSQAACGPLLPPNITKIMNTKNNIKLD